MNENEIQIWFGEFMYSVGIFLSYWGFQWSEMAKYQKEQKQKFCECKM